MKTKQIICYKVTKLKYKTFESDVLKMFLYAVFLQQSMNIIEGRFRDCISLFQKELGLSTKDLSEKVFRGQNPMGVKREWTRKDKMGPLYLYGGPSQPRLTLFLNSDLGFSTSYITPKNDVLFILFLTKSLENTLLVI